MYNLLTARRPPRGRTIRQGVSLYKITQNVDGTAATPRPHSLSAATPHSRVLKKPVFRGRPRCRSNGCNCRWPLWSTSAIQAATSSYTRCLASAKGSWYKSLPDLIRSLTDCIRRTMVPSGHLTRAHQASFEVPEWSPHQRFLFRGRLIDAAPKLSLQLLHKPRQRIELDADLQVTATKQ